MDLTTTKGTPVRTLNRHGLEMMIIGGKTYAVISREVITPDEQRIYLRLANGHRLYQVTCYHGRTVSRASPVRYPK